jgi:hypothetical protein
MVAEADLPVSWAAADTRPRGPLFFLSYARDGRATQYVADFFKDLSDDVAQLVGRPAGSDPGFMDRSVQGGALWLSDLLHAVGSCQVFVALLSDPYVASEWCSKEWYAFSQRPVRSRDTDEVTNRTGIVPILWAPMPERPPPRVISAVQRFEPRGLEGEDISARYRVEGVYGLKRLNRIDLYQGVVWHLAQAIARFNFAYKVESLVLEPDNLRDIFREKPL